MTDHTHTPDGGSDDLSLQSTSEFLEQIHSLGIVPDEVCLYLQYAGARRRVVTADELCKEFDITDTAAAKLLDWFAANEAVTFPSPTRDAVKVHVERLRYLTSFLQQVDSGLESRQRRLLADGPLDDVRIITSTPPGQAPGEAPLLQQLHQLVATAQDQITLTTPFFNEFGVRKFASRLVSRAGDGVTVDIITRGSEESGATEAAQEIIETAQDSGPTASSNLTIYTYASEKGRLHAKALIADRERAYIGSANLTSYSLQDAIEMGVVVEGPAAATVAEFLNTVRSWPETETFY